MTENEAIKELETSIDLAKMCTQNYERKNEIQCYEMAINVLKEIQKYRKIGTVEECRAAVEKQTAAKPLGGMDADGNDYAICRECSAILSDGEWFAQYCPDCGKKVDWSDENEQRT